ncbi:MAG: hypothetical protein SWN10_23445 [Pseudomonadota bacterium]|nr:hypothetical protein [Pseudomonadota bacterium]
MDSWKHYVLSLFWPIGLSMPVSEAASNDLEECVKSWQRGEKREPTTFVGDAEIRKGNWKAVGPHFKNYFVRWAGVLALMIGLGIFSPLAEIRSDSVFGAWFGSLLIALTWISGVLTAMHGFCHLRFMAFKRGEKVWE